MIEIYSKKQGMKSLIKKLVELENFTGFAGIQKNEGVKLVRKKGNSRTNKINMATLAYQMEQFASWIQPVTKHIRGDSGEIVGVMPAGRRITRPPRPFIHFNRIPEVYNNFRAGVRDIVRQMIRNHMQYPTQKFARTLMQHIVDFAVDAQKFIIINKKSKIANSALTVRVKGKDHPLLHTGQLLNSITGKVKSLSRKTRNVLKNTDLQKVNDIYKKLGGKA